MQLVTPGIISKSQKERLIMPNIAYCIHAGGPVIWNSFLNETEKNILSQHFFKHKIKEKIFEFEEELNFF